ncbi:translocation/assembly module TamB domain-containing protein [Amorphus orientalis]|uniref:Translocation and assembly module TamB n=1 Tax=Amorphus orientalis TaxID=649198 RepID=A0AAE3VLG5_9HYPH|nr:translocation/assembly module TamB domain-containing protein [Amorphus orientalis]MDQ0313930.1 translocation and assembly module TamB [Amorphus orientalis]
MTRLILALLVFLTALPAFAQDSSEEDDRSFLTRFISEQLSAPNRQIRLSGIQGALSSNATIAEISVADDEGVWLRIVNASIQWNRTALFRRRLQIDRLAADRIEMTRRPLADESLPSPEATPFQVPELPVAVILNELDVPQVTFGEPVFGLASELSVTGSLRLQSGELETDLDIKRQDGPGGELTLQASFSNETRRLALDLDLSEPADGVVANLLKLEGEPPIDLKVQGEGPLDNLDITMSLDADGDRLVSGAVRLRERTEGLGFEARLEGSIGELIAPEHREAFAGDGLVTLSGVSRTEGGFAIDSLDVRTDVLTLTASAATTSDGFLRRLTVDGELNDPDDGRLSLPGAPDATLQNGRISIAYGEADRQDWNGVVELTGIETDAVTVQTVRLVLGGLAENLDDPEARRVTFGVDGEVSGISSDDPGIEKAFGGAIRLDVDGSWQANRPITLTRAALSGNGLSASLSGTIQDAAFRGTIAVDAADLAPFSDVADRDLAGALNMRANGSVQPISGMFDLTLDGTADGLQIGMEPADQLLAGSTRITGRVARDENGLRTDTLRVESRNLALEANGGISSETADFRFDLALADLQLLTPEASGRLTARGTARGQEGVIDLSFDADVPSGTLSGRPLRDGELAFTGTLREGDLTGTVSGSAFLDGHRVSLASDIATQGDRRSLTGLEFVAGGTTLTGDLTQTEAGLFQGTLDLKAPDVSLAAALFLAEASGSVDAHIELSNTGERQDASVEAQVRDLVVEAAQIASADIQAEIEDLLGVPTVEGTIDGRDIVAAGYTVTTLQASANRDGESTDFTADAALSIGTTIAAAGRLTPIDGGFRLQLSKADLAQGDLAARLTRTASLQIAGQTITIDGLALDVGGGRVSANGTIADTLDLTVDLASVPLSIANTIQPELGLGGTLTGTANVGGSRDNPDVTFSVDGREISAAQLRDAGLSALNVSARGTSSANRLQIDATVTSPDGFRTTARGSVPLGDGNLDLTIALERFPLSVLNAAAPGQDLAGAITGEARVTGPLANPAADFTLSGSGLSAAPLNDFGAAPLELRASGSYANQILSLQSTEVGGPQGLSLSASGRVPLSGGGLDLAVRGAVPLSLANRQLADRGTQVAGTLSFETRISGPLTDPRFNGSFSTAGAEVVDPETSVRLTDIVINGSIDGDRITLGTVRAAVAGGGGISASGTISIDPRAGFPADIRVNLDQARYVDEDFVVATVSGSLAMTGQLTRDPLVSGEIRIERAEIMIPDSIGGGAPPIDVTHIDPPAAVVTTLKRAKMIGGTPVPTSRPSVVQLDIRISAPNQIFVRGRGLDAELGGEVRLTGPLTNVQPVGGFRLIRGHLSIVGQRINFDEGTVTLIGDLDPFIDFSATTQGNGITVTVSVRGRVSNPEISFSSQPELPEDEVLAQLIFKRSLSELSATQIAQLAAAAAELAGGGNTSLLNNLRQATGLDELDIVTDSEGNAAVQAGRYINENIYLGVEAGAAGTTRGTVNLDITPSLKAKGSIGSDGDSSLGLFFERDY